MPTKLIKLKPILSLLAVTIFLFSMMVLIGKVLIPFIAALILAYILNPLVDLFEHKFSIKRKISALILSLVMIMIIIAIPVYLVPVLIDELKVIVDKIPQIVILINKHILTPLNNELGTRVYLDLKNLKLAFINNPNKTINNIDAFQNIAQNGMIIVEIVIYLILTPFALFYSILNWHNILQFFEDLIPRSFLEPMHALFNDIDVMLSSYLRGQLSVMIIMAFYYSVGLTIVKLPSGAAIGIVTGLLVFIPYLGVLSGLLTALVIGLAQFTSGGDLLAILAVFAVGHTLEGAFVTPFLVGGKIGLNPVMIILALMVFGKVFGIVGVLLALPLSTIAVVLLRHAKQYYQNTQYYSD